MPKQELLGEVKKLIAIGKEKGFLTYDELNSTLPAEVVSSDQFGSIMAMFGEMDIEIVEATEGGVADGGRALAQLRPASSLKEDCDWVPLPSSRNCT